MISEYDTNNDIPKYGNALTKHSTNLVNSSQSFNCNLENCSSTQNSVDVKTYKDSLNRLIHPLSDENRTVLMKNKNSNLNTTAIPEIDSKASELHNNHVNGMVSELNNSKTCRTSLEIDNAELNSLTTDIIQKSVCTENNSNLSDNEENQCNLKIDDNNRVDDSEKITSVDEGIQDGDVSSLEAKDELSTNPVKVCNTETNISLESSNHDANKSPSVLDDKANNHNDTNIKSCISDTSDKEIEDECMKKKKNCLKNKSTDISEDEERDEYLSLLPAVDKNNPSNDKEYLEKLNNSVTETDNVSVPAISPEGSVNRNKTLEKSERRTRLKRSIDSESENERKVKRLKTSSVQKKNLNSSSTPPTFYNELSESKEEFSSSSKNFIKECCESSLEQEGEMNPNKLYLGLLNDVLAEEKDLVKEPEVVRTKLQRIKRKDLEDMIIDQLMTKILQDHELGHQKELCKRLEHTLEAANKRALRLTQEVESLRNITNKVVSEHKRRKTFLVHPTKVKRSVGIQANKTYISQGYTSAVLPDSEVRIVVPSKYQKIKKISDKNSSLKTRGKSKSRSQFKDVKAEKREKDFLGISKNIDHKLNTLREDLEQSSIKDKSYPYPKRSKHGSKHTTVNGKPIKTEKTDILTPVQSPLKNDDCGLICPAPLPHMSYSDEDLLGGRIPPGPTLKVHLRNKSIILSWNIITAYDETSILSYQLYSYEESKDAPSTDLWQKIGSVKALELPMACTLTQFKCGRTYHFAVRAMSKKGRLGPFSIPKSLRMPPK